MNCQDVQKFVYTYLDAEFEDRERAEFEAHLTLCDPCRGAVERDASFRDAVRRHLHTPPVDTALAARVQQRLSQTHRSANLSRSLGVPLALAASMALALVSWRAMQTSNDPEITLPAVAELAPEAASPAMPPTADLAAAPARPAPGAAVAAADSVRTSDPKLVELRAQALAALAPKPAEPGAERAPDAPESAARMLPVNPRDDVRLASGPASGEVLGGGVDSDFLVQRSRFGAVRSASSLRAIVRAHARPLPPEVHGTSREVQRFLAERLPFVGAPPIAEGVGVRLYGARLSQMAGRPVVQYYYDTFGKPLTAFRFVAQTGDEPIDDPEVVQASPGDPRAKADGMVVDRLAGYAILHAMRGDDLVCVVSELDAAELRNLLQGPTAL